MEIEFMKADNRAKSKDGENRVNARIKELEKEGYKVDVEMKYVDRNTVHIVLKKELVGKPRMTG